MILPAPPLRGPPSFPIFAPFHSFVLIFSIRPSYIPPKSTSDFPRPYIFSVRPPSVVLPEKTKINEEISMRLKMEESPFEEQGKRAEMEKEDRKSTRLNYSH